MFINLRLQAIDTNMIASFCALSVRIKLWYLLFYIYNKEKLKPVLFLQ